MNYLAHAFLSFGDRELLVGNMIADYVKGRKALLTFPEKIQEGILLHRAIDEFTDKHDAAKQASLFFQKNYGRYSPAIIDSLFDHFLAVDEQFFSTEKTLFDFSQKTYNQLSFHKNNFPEKFAGLFPYMIEHNWLFNYRSHEGMKRSLKGLQKKAKYMPETDFAFELFLEKYQELKSCYERLMIEMIPFVLGKINKTQFPTTTLLNLEN